jgi:hypothetical protein|nr:hypothetical protein [Neorhizobium tomejilense]
MAGLDIAFEISGKITDIETIAELAIIAEADGASFDWLYTAHADEIEATIIEKAQSNSAICFVKANTTDPLEQLAAFCRDRGLSYRKQFSYPGTDGYFSADIWSPEEGKLVSFALDDEGKPSIPMTELTKAVEKGPKAVAELMSHINGTFSRADTAKLEVSEDVMANWLAANPQIKRTPSPRL